MMKNCSVWCMGSYLFFRKLVLEIYVDEFTSPLFPEAVVAGEGEDVDVASDPEACIKYLPFIRGTYGTGYYSIVQVYRTSYHSTVKV